MKNKILFASLIVILFLLNYQIFQKENILSKGKTVLLELAPVDPRSLMQGDYMVLRYKISENLSGRNENKDGYILIKPDSKGVWQYDQIYNGHHFRNKDFSKNPSGRNENKDGFIVIEPDSNGQWQSVKSSNDNEIINTEDQLLRYRIRGQNIKLGAESFFFQEGQGKTYQNARYGELKVSEDGESVLVGLRDDKLNRLVPLEERNLP